MSFIGIKQNVDFYEIIKKGIIAFFIRGIGIISGYLFMYLTVKLYGVETQGRLALSFSFMILGGLFCRLGVDTNFVKIFAIENNFENSRGIYFKIIPVFLCITLIVSSIVFFLAKYISENFFNDLDLELYLKWISPCIVFYTFTLLNSAVFRGLKLNTLYSFLFNGGRFLFSLIFFGLLYYLFDDITINIVVSHTLSVFVLFIISCYFIWLKLAPKSIETSYNKITFIKESLPMLFSASMIVFLGWTDILILGFFKGSDLVGKYSVIIKIAAMTSVAFQAIDSILAPKLSNAYHSNKMRSFRKMVDFSLYINLILSSLIVIIIFMFDSQILKIFGENFLDVKLALKILCLGQLFNAICGPVGSILQMTGNQKIFQNILFLSLIINVSLNLLLVKHYGVNGVAIATAVSLSLWNILGYIYIRKNIY